MKTEWDYSELAEAYVKRPDYAEEAIQGIRTTCGLDINSHVVDVGAGVGHLSRRFAPHVKQITAVEPNDNMRAVGKGLTGHYDNISWIEATAESTGLPDNIANLVSFGSSFNVCDRTNALKEVKRILVPSGWFAAMWNHRYLEDEIQNSIEEIIKSFIPEYNYGVRRDDQTDFLKQSGFFKDVQRISAQVSHEQNCSDVVEAWRSHCTLKRQAGDKFHRIVDGIQTFLGELDGDSISIPYTTEVWIAQFKS